MKVMKVKVCLDRCYEIISSTPIYIDFGDYIQSDDGNSR